jgi:uncharacterized integral membrane protein
VGARWIVLAVIVVLLLIFVFQNQATCTVRFLWWPVEMPTIALLIVTFILGLIVGWVLAAFGRRQGREEKKLRGADSAGE